MLEVGSLQATITLDISDFTENMQEVITTAKTLGSKLKSALSDSAQGFSAILASTKELREELELVSAAMKSFNASTSSIRNFSAFSTMVTHTSRLRETLAGVNAELSNVRNNAATAATGMSGLGDSVKSAQATIDLITGEISGITPEALEAANAFQVMDNAAEEIAGAVRNIQPELQGASGEATDLENELKQANKTIEQLQRSVRSTKTALASSNDEANKLQGNLKKANTWATDLKRIIAGIVFSQAFYEALNVLEQLVFGSFQFANNMDQAAIAFKYLLDDASQVDSFINDLQNFAIASPLDTQSVTNGVRQLMAMGFTAESAIPVMQTLADTSAVFTSEADAMSDTISHVTLALGQMLASGTVMTQELRQLYNAGIPVFTILQEELGLTAAEVQNIGNLSIDSTQAVLALLNGLEKRYAGAAEEFTKTIPGALSQIKDAIFVLYDELAEEPHNALKDWVVGISNEIQHLMQVARNFGAGGFMEAIVPIELHQTIRLLVGSLMELGEAFAAIGNIIWDSFGNAISLISIVLSGILPGLTTFINYISQMALAIYYNVPFVRELVAALSALLIIGLLIQLFSYLWKVMKLGTIVLAVAKSVMVAVKSIYTLATAMLTANKATLLWVAGILVLISVLAALFGQSGSFSNLFSGLGNIDVGFNTSDILQPEYDTQPPTEYADSLEGVVDGYEEVEEAANSAGKAMDKNFNQSFDEVFTIDIQEPTGSGALGDLGDLGGLGDLGELVGELEDLNLDDIPIFNSDFLEPMSHWLGFLPIALAAIGEFTVDLIWLLLAPIGELLVDVGTLLWNLIEAIIEFGIDFIAAFANLGTNLNTLFVNLIGNFWSLITNFWKNLISTIVNYFVGIFKAFVDFYSNIFKAFGDFFAEVGVAFTKFWDTITEGEGTFLENLISGLFIFIADFLVAIGNFFLNILGSVGTFIWDLLQVVGQLMLDLWNLVTTALWDFGVLLADFFMDSLSAIGHFLWDIISVVGNFIWNILKAIGTFLGDVLFTLGAWVIQIRDFFAQWFGFYLNMLWEWLNTVTSDISGWWSSFMNSLSNFFSNLWDSLWGWMSDIANSVSNWWNNLWADKDANISVNGQVDNNVSNARSNSPTTQPFNLGPSPMPASMSLGNYSLDQQSPMSNLPGHSEGGIFNREHLAWFAEGNKREAAIPLDNYEAMYPFSSAVARQLAEQLPTDTSVTNGATESVVSDELPPLYVGTLVADETGLKELERKLRIIRVKEERRGV